MKGSLSPNQFYRLTLHCLMRRFCFYPSNPLNVTFSSFFWRSQAKRGKRVRDPSSIHPLQDLLSELPHPSSPVMLQGSFRGNRGIGTTLPEGCLHVHILVICLCTPPAIVNALLADAILSMLKEQNTAYHESCQLTAYPCTKRCLSPACKRAETMTFIHGFFTETSRPTNSE